MITFKVILPDKVVGEYQISKNSNVKEFIQSLKEQNQNKDWNNQELGLYLFNQLLKEDGSVDKIICNHNTDSLTLKVKKGEIIKKFQKIVTQAMEQKTKAGFEKAFKKSSTLQELPITNQEKNVQKFLSCLVVAIQKIVLVSRQKSLNFVENVQENEQGRHQTTSQDPSLIGQEEDPLKNNNDTVLGILDHFNEPKGQNNINQDHFNEPQKNIINQDHSIESNNLNFNQKNNSTQIKPKSLSPEDKNYLERKKKAEENLNDPFQQAKAKQLVAELNKERKEQEDRKKIQLHNESYRLQKSIEKYKIEREQQKEYQNQQKCMKIRERLEEMQRHQDLKKQTKQEQNQLIKELKIQEIEKRKQIEEKDQILKKIYYEDAKLKLSQRKKLAIPIRLEEIIKHEEDYLNKKQLLKLEKDQKKLEKEIVMQQETKQLYKARNILQKVIHGDQKLKNQENAKKQQNAEKLLRKQKYAEIVKEYHKPNMKIQTNKSGHSLQEEYIDFLKEGEGKQSAKKVDSIRNKLYRQRQQGSEKNLYKIQNVLNLKKIQKTIVTESLEKGFIPNPSVYYHPKPMKMEPQFEELQKQKKPINYLKELEQERMNQQGKLGQLKTNSYPRLQNDYQSIMERGKRYEKEAQRKEHQAYYLNDEKLKEEADDLFLKSVQEKIKFLEKI
ncbi:unnamed protein product [Paramecium pentaurelia]|uniref:Uncharacterized protein n=1 Tax=Paramecium pentaurelia TaxID=43138 RepID=A0A8S1SGE7_9CILI|nr:unnamed protein product [Paramecium pentaurelia]